MSMAQHLATAAAAPGPVDPDALRRKVARHVLPFIFLLYIVSYLDRANAGFAKLAMADDLKFSDAVFGLGFGIFFIGYLFLEIPGALLVERWSARKWFARILISWGIASALTAFVQTPMQFYAARFILGVAEAGFFPGIIVYFTHWFTSRDRARALAGLVMAIPFCLALGAPLSAMLLKIDWLGLIGWKWLFLLEGLPAVILGVATLYVLDDRPRDAKWLAPRECEWLCEQLDAEARAKDAMGKTTFWQALRLRNVRMLTLGIFATNTGGYAFTFWLPTAIKGISGGSNSHALWWSGAIYAFGILGVYVSGRSSDRTGDRKWHCVAGQCATALFLAASAIPGQPIWLVMAWLCLTGLTASSWPVPFWAMSTMTLTASVAAASIGFINMFANLAGYLGNYNVGLLEAHGIGQRGCLLFLAGCYLLGGIFVSLVRVPSNLLNPGTTPIRRHRR
jgi:MFS transporter, ACS family, tartrate transporter